MIYKIKFIGGDSWSATYNHRAPNIDISTISKIACGPNLDNVLGKLRKEKFERYGHIDQYYTIFFTEKSPHFKYFIKLYNKVKLKEVLPEYISKL